MTLTGWGNYPTIDSHIITPANAKDVLANIAAPKGGFIARGLGRSYGDSALAPRVISTARLDSFIKFDETAGLLTCYSGVSLGDILAVIVPKGWFLPVVPGTKFVSIGGAIASDVHGKNHHIDGCFSDHITTLKIATVSKGIIECSKDKNAALFYATCGGMGLTGVIIEATLKLRPIKSSHIHQMTLRTNTLEETLDLFEEHKKSTYSVAWIDCLASGESLGRSLLMLGEHADKGGLETATRGRLNIPVTMPSGLLNRHTIGAFNTLYYNRIRAERTQQTLHYEPFFFPLDRIHNWNRLYGKNGFCQYQFVLPKDAGLAGMTAVLTRIAQSKRGSFLAVLKALGKGNKNLLSFPMEGYTLALDFKRDKGLFALLDELDKIVLEYGGRIYLTKDARCAGEVFKHGYPNWQAFMKLRARYGADTVFNSLQSKRLGL